MAEREVSYTYIDDSIFDDENLTGTQKMVYIALSYFASQDGKDAHPSHHNIAKIAGYTRRTVITAIAELTDRGYLQKTSRKTPEGGCTTNWYILRK